MIMAEKVTTCMIVGVNSESIDCRSNYLIGKSYGYSIHNPSWFSFENNYGGYGNNMYVNGNFVDF